MYDGKLPKVMRPVCLFLAALSGVVGLSAAINPVPASLTSFFKSLSLWPSTGRHFRHYKVAGVFMAAVILFVGSSFQLIPNFS